MIILHDCYVRLLKRVCVTRNYRLVLILFFVPTKYKWCLLFCKYLCNYCRCKPDGSYSRMQCQENTGQCWCVDKDNVKIDGTTKRGNPQCNHGMILITLLCNNCFDCHQTLKRRFKIHVRHYMLSKYIICIFPENNCISRKAVLHIIDIKK